MFEGLCKAGTNRTQYKFPYLETRATMAPHVTSGQVQSGTSSLTVSLFLQESEMKSMFVRFVREDAGQDLIEYALLAGFISLIAVTAIALVGTNVDLVYDRINVELDKIN